MLFKNKFLLKTFLIFGFVAGMPTLGVAKISVAPQYVLFDKGTPKVQTVSVINNSEKEKTYNVKLLHYKQMPDGTYKQVETEEENNKFADNLLFFGPRRFTLAPNVAQSIKIQRKPKADLEAGEYKSHLLFQEAEEENVATTDNAPKEKGLSFTITALYGVSIPVVVRNGDLQSNVILKNLKHEKNYEKDLLLLDIVREGNKSLRGDVVVKYKNKEIGILKGINIFLSIDKRSVSIPLNLGDIKVEDIKGKTLTVEYTSDGKVLTSTEVVY